MSPGPDYHGWTHAPKSAGGTDPIPGTSTDGIWGWCMWNAEGFEVTNGSWDFPPGWTDAWISDRALGEGWLALRDPDEFGLLVTELSTTGGVWLMDVKAQFDNSLGDLAPGDWLGVGNLAGIGFSISNADVHGFFPGDLITEQAADNTCGVTTTRIVAGTPPFSGYNVLAEVGNIASASGNSVNLNQIDITIARLMDGPSSYHFAPPS